MDQASRPPRSHNSPRGESRPSLPSAAPPHQPAGAAGAGSAATLGLLAKMAYKYPPQVHCQVPKNLGSWHRNLRSETSPTHLLSQPRCKAHGKRCPAAAAALHYSSDPTRRTPPRPRPVTNARTTSRRCGVPASPHHTWLARCVRAPPPEP